MEHKRLRDFIEFAISREIEAAEFYESNAGRSVLAVTRNLFTELAGVERDHERRLRSFLVSGKADLFLGARSPDLRISDFLVPVSLQEDSSIQDILIFAAKKEQKAFELYSRLALLEEDQAVEILFRELAESERNHKFELEKEYERLVIRDN